MSQRERNEWILRAKERVLQNAEKTDSCIKDIMDLYDETANQLENEIRAMFQRYAGENGLTNAEAETLLSSGEYSRWRKSMENYLAESKNDCRTLQELNTLSVKSRISRKEQLLSQIYRQMMDLSGDTETKLTDLLGDLYKTNYYRGCYDLQCVSRLGFTVAKVDQRMLKRILEYPWSGKNYSQALWGNTDRLAALARRELTMGFMAGSSVQQMAKAINDVMGKGRYAAERLVRTESSYFSNQGELQSYRELGIKEYTFLGGGCEICQQLNGRTFSMDDAEAGLNLPPIHPNCKCTIRAKAKIDLFKNREGANPLKENPKFEEWKKRHVKGNGLSAAVGGKEGIEHEEKKVLEKIDFHDKKLVESRLKNYTEEIVKDNEKENAVCITASGQVYWCFGRKAAVYPDFDLGQELVGACVTHNHPISETHYSFSAQDVGLFLNYRLSELIGTDEEYIYRMLRTEGTEYEEPGVIDHMFRTELYQEAMSAAMFGEIDMDTDEYDYIVRRLAEKYGFQYERKKR